MGIEDKSNRIKDIEVRTLKTHHKPKAKVIEHISGKKTLKVCRIAGQYGKPRSKPTEIGEDGKEIMSFKVGSTGWGQKTPGVLLAQ